jgi:hypothetical protein
MKSFFKRYIGLLVQQILIFYFFFKNFPLYVFSGCNQNFCYNLICFFFVPRIKNVAQHKNEKHIQKNNFRGPCLVFNFFLLPKQQQQHFLLLSYFFLYKKKNYCIISNISIQIQIKNNYI